MIKGEFHLIDHRTPDSWPTGAWEHSYLSFEQATLAMFSRFYRSAADIGAGRPFRNLYVSVQDSESRTLARIITDKDDNVRFQTQRATPYLNSIRSLLNEAEFGRNGTLYEGDASDVVIGRLGNWGRGDPFFDRMVSLLIRDTLRLENPKFPYIVQCLNPEATSRINSSETYYRELAYFTTPQAALSYLGVRVKELSQDPLPVVNRYRQVDMLIETKEGRHNFIGWSQGEDPAAILETVKRSEASMETQAGEPFHPGYSLHFSSRAIDYTENDMFWPPEHRIHSIYFFPVVDGAVTAMMAVDRESLQYKTAWVHRLPFFHHSVWIESPSGQAVAEIGMKSPIHLPQGTPRFEELYMPPACFMGIDHSLATVMQNKDAASILQSAPWQMIGYIKSYQCVQSHQFLHDQIAFIGCLQQANDQHRAINDGVFSLQPVYQFSNGSVAPPANPIPIDRLSDGIAFMADLGDIPFQSTPDGMHLNQLSIIENARNIELARAYFDAQGLTTHIIIHPEHLPAYAIDHFLLMDIPVKTEEKLEFVDRSSKSKVKTGNHKRKPGPDENSTGRSVR